MSLLINYQSPKISKIKDNELNLLKRNDKEEEEIKEEEINKKNDRELEELLKATKLLEKYTAEQLTGKQRRKYNDGKLIELGAKPDNRGKKVPTPISLGMQVKRKEKEQKELEEAKNLGLYHKSIKHKWATSSSTSPNNHKNNNNNINNTNIIKNKFKKDKGIGIGIGKIKNGILTLSSKDIKRIEKTNNKKGGKSGRSNGKNGGIKKSYGKKNKFKK
ncbi:1048_t:CDS:2 [Diversispora eburnea]|uniref:1048_t:CDS:1 n=1 Tax=Diversispora eburnea TaxID=1213867 RepID=A0A9N9AKW9_9GLOM|nr:1048_t:CDS:2 [Diversispora eburnea]